MAEKSPDSIVTQNAGSFKVTVATFTTNDIDDNDTWVAGIKSAFYYNVSPTIDGPNDCTIDAYDATTGTFTFGSAANQTAKVVVFHFDY